MLSIVLVGGFGTRLRPLTNDVPKPMLPVGHEPMIARLIARLERSGVTDVILALGFQPEPFFATFPDDRCGGVRMHYAVEPEPLGTGGATRFAADAYRIDHDFCGPVVVANGDVMTDLNVECLVKAHRSAVGNGREATLHLTAVDDPAAFGVADLAADGTVHAFAEKPAPGTEPSNLINGGTYVFEPAVFDRIPAGARVSLERDTFPALVAAGVIGGYATDDYWLDLGVPDLYRAANLDLIRSVRNEWCKAIHADAVVDPDATIVDSLVGPATIISSGTTVVESVILPGAVVGKRTQIESSLVMGRVGADARLIEAIIGADGQVADGDVVAHTAIPEPETN